MLPLDSLDKFKDSLEFIDLNNEEERNKLRQECDKLIYLKTYPNKVRIQINEQETAIRSIEHALQVDISSQKSALAQIKRRQDLEPRYKELSEMKEKLRKLKEELKYAEHVKATAGVRLQLYEELLSKDKEGALDDGDSTDNE